MPGIDDETLLNLYFEKCEFKDECDTCGNPNEEQSWASMTGCGSEVKYYVCQTCALRLIETWRKNNDT